VDITADSIPEETIAVHGITKDMTLGKRPIKDHIDAFIGYCDQAKTFVGHNIKFDIGMIVGQINKIMEKTSDPKYMEFLQRFQIIGKELPENMYCTMTESKEVCARIRRTEKVKNDKLMEVHRLLFNQIVGGQLHNALVDIAVTLRVYIYLTLGIDICQSMTPIHSNENGERVFKVHNNNDICNLIKPEPDVSAVQSQPVPYEGEVITGLAVLPNNELEEKKIMVNIIAKQMASKFVGSILQQPYSNPQAETMCTIVTICSARFTSGKKKGEVCGRPRISNGEFCAHHAKPRKSKKRGLTVQEITEETEETGKKTSGPTGGLKKKRRTKKNKKRGYSRRRPKTYL